jgi:5-methylcytosine-specific restriction protein B
MPLAGGTRFSIPENVLIIGTMNTADRSIALVDFALRRRFAFLELLPEYDVLMSYQLKRGFNTKGLVRALQDINVKINDKNFHLGISFFMVDELAGRLEHIWKMEIETYLEEYFFSQPEIVSNFRWDRMKDKIIP